MRRFLLALIFFATAAVVSAQVYPITLPSHVIVDSCSGCGGAGTLGQATMANSSPVVIASDQSTVPVSLASVPAHNVTNAGTFAVQVSSAPANASTNVTQWNGTTVDANSGLKSAGTLRVVLATDQPALTNKLLVTPDSVALPANQSVNVSQLAGTTTDTNSGVKSAGTLRVVLATDQPQLTNKLLVTPDANSAVNVAQFGGTNVVTGTGASGAGVPRVTLSNDSSLAANQSVNVAQINGVTNSTGMGVSDTGTRRVALAQEATYSAGNTAATATAAGTGIFFEICGSASKTVRIQRVVISGTIATGVKNGDVIITKRSAVTTGGTATTLTQTPYDSNSAAGTATNVRYFTVLGTAGTSVGVVANGEMYLPLTGTGTYTTPIDFLWRDQDSESPTLRGTTQCLTAHFGTTTTNAPSLLVRVVWTEK